MTARALILTLVFSVSTGTALLRSSFAESAPSASELVSQTIELSTEFSARTTPDFSSSHTDNFLGVLPAGTEARILEWITVRGFNLFGVFSRKKIGLRLLITSGPFEGQEAWIAVEKSTPLTGIRPIIEKEKDADDEEDSTAKDNVASDSDTGNDVTNAEPTNNDKSMDDNPAGGVPAHNDVEDPPLTRKTAPRAAWDDLAETTTGWTDSTARAIDAYGASLLSIVPADISQFCPNYPVDPVERKAFWIYFISTLAYEESKLNPENVYTESFKGSNHKRVKSRGLLQLSLESSQAYDCGFRNEQEIHDSEKNLTCGVKILNQWIGYDKRITGKVQKIWRGGARYWGVLRNKSLARIKKANASLALCKKAQTAPPKRSQAQKPIQKPKLKKKK